MGNKLALKVFEYYNMLPLIFFTWSIPTVIFKPTLILTGVVIVVNIIFILKKGLILSEVIKKNKLSILIILILILSNLYSITRNLTIRYTIFAIMATIYGISISIIYKKDSFNSLLSKYFIMSIIVSLLFIVFIPSYGLMNYKGMNVARGAYTHKNVLARTMFLAQIFLVNGMFKKKDLIKKYIYFIFFGISIFLIIISKSSTILLYSFIFLLVTVILIKKRLLQRIYIKAIYCIVILFNIIIFFISSPNLNNILSSIRIGSKDLTFTGRNNIWYYAIKYIFKKPFLGYGYEAFWENSIIMEEFYSKYWFYSPHAHNGYLNICLNIGIISLIIIICMIVKGLQANDFLTIITLTFILLINLTESSFLDGASLLFWVIIVFNYAKSFDISSVINGKE